VGSSDLPLAALELPSGRFLAVNPPLAKALGADVDDLVGSYSMEWLHPDQRHAAQQCLQALADGGLTGYQAIRTQADPADPDEEFSIWVSAAEAGGARFALASLVPHGGRDDQFGSHTSVPEVPAAGDLVLGTVDGSWRIDGISQDVTSLFGLTVGQCVGAPVLGAIHPSDGLEQLPALAEAPQLGELTSRELAVLTRLIDGQRVSGIAADLFVSPSTVRNHLSSIYTKLGVHGQVDLIRLLRREPARPVDD